MKSLTFCLFLTLVLAAGSKKVHAQPADPILVELYTHGVPELAPRIEYRDGIKFIAYIQAKQGANGDIMFTSASGNAFSGPVAVTTSGKVNASLQRGPEFVFSPNGFVHLVWMEQKINNSPDIFYSRSTNGGMAWSAPLDISRDQQRATQDFPSIASDSAGNLYVAWIDNRDLIDGNSQNDHLYFTRSLDQGNTWDTPRRAENNPGNIGGSCECCRTAIAASPDGDLYVAYRTNMQNMRDIFVARSYDRGETFGESIRVQTAPWMIMACPATGPMIALDERENLHIVYRSAGNQNRSAVYYNLLPNGSSRTFPEIPLTALAGSGANYPDIAVSEAGSLSVVYQQSGSVYNRSSSDGGNTWTPAAKFDMTASTQTYPTVAYDPASAGFSTVWQDDRRDMGDVMLATGDELTAVTLPVMTFFERSLTDDSARFTWGVASSGLATWFELKTLDTTIISFGSPLMIPRTYVDLSAITITPWTAIGKGESARLLPLSVGRTEGFREVALSHHPVTAGERVTIALSESASLNWKIYDIQGREHGAVTSSPVDSRHEIHVPDLTPGVYQMRCATLGLNIKLVVR